MEPEGDWDTRENSGMSYLETGPKPWALTPSLAVPDVFCTCAFPRPAHMHTCLTRPQAHADGPLPQLPRLSHRLLHTALHGLEKDEMTPPSWHALCAAWGGGKLPTLPGCSG